MRLHQGECAACDGLAMWRGISRIEFGCHQVFVGLLAMCRCKYGVVVEVAGKTVDNSSEQWLTIDHQPQHFDTGVPYNLNL